MTIYLQTNHQAEAAWFNQNWSFRKAITVTVSNNTNNINNLETLLSINTSTLISAGKLQSSCQDLRFTSQSGQQLPYYIDSACNTTATKVWVAVDVVPANTTTYTLYMYYGNPSVVAGTNPTRFDLFKGLAGYWPMNETTDSWNDTSGEVKDDSVNGNNGQGVGYNGTTSPVAGEYGNGGTFIGNTNWIKINNASSLEPTGTFTISSWIKIASNTNVDSVFQSASANSNLAGIGLEIAGDGGGSPHKICVDSGKNTGTTRATDWQAVCSTTNVDDSTWHMVTGTWDGSKLNIYVDGKLSNSVAWANTPAYAAANYVLIAEEQDTPSGFNSGFNGNIDDMRLYTRALSSSEVVNLYNNPGVLASYATTNSNPSTSFGTEQVGTAPVAYWKFDDGTGTIASDATSQHNNGTLSGSTLPTWQTEDQCISGKCLYFNGITSNVSVASISGQIQTVSLWVKPATSSASLLQLSTGAGGKDIYATNGVVFTDGIISPTIYVNGNMNGTFVPNQWNQVEVTTPNGIIATSPDIGQLWRGVLNGYVDEVKFYNYARTASQVTTDYNARGSTQGASAVLGAATNSQFSALNNGLVGYWKFDESSYNNVSGEVKDSSGNGNNGTGSGYSATSLPPGKFGNAATFNGTSQYIDAGNASNLNFGTGNFSVSAWYKLSANSGDETIIAKSANITGNAVGYSLFYDQPDGGLLIFKVPNGSTNIAASASWTYNTNWHHIVGVRNGNTISLYLDGVFLASNTGLNGVNVTNGSSLRIGDDASINYFSGTIDEARIYNRALSPQDVQSLCNYAPGPVAYYNFEEGTGSIVNDRSGNANTGTWQGTLGQQWSRGKYGWRELQRNR